MQYGVRGARKKTKLIDKFSYIEVRGRVLVFVLIHLAGKFFKLNKLYFSAERSRNHSSNMTMRAEPEIYLVLFILKHAGRVTAVGRRIGA